MTKPKIEAGQKFNKLTVVSRSANAKNGTSRWLCACECGNTKIIEARHLKAGNIKSCGCLTVTKLVSRNKTHGMSSHPLYSRVAGVVQRCTNPKMKAYKNYGGRGITVCDEWKTDFSVMIMYIVDMYSDWEHRIRQGQQIDRIDNNGNYEPGNIRLVTPKDNCANRRERGASQDSYTPPSLSNTNKNVKNLEGMIFGQLTVIKRNPSNHKNKRVMWDCLCTCGTETTKTSSLLIRGQTKSCGCLARANTAKRSTSHGLRKDPTYYVWNNLKQKAKKGKIALVKEWQSDFTLFYSWLRDNNWSKGQGIGSVSFEYGPDTCFLK